MSPYHFLFKIMRKLSLLPVAISLSFTITACQSTNSGNSAEVEEKLIETKIKIIQSKLDSGKAMQALFEAEPLYKKFPNNPKVLTIIAFTDLALKNNMRAVINLKKVYQSEKTASSALNLSSAYIASKNYDKALAVIDEGIKLGTAIKYKNISRLYHNKGHIYELKGQEELAISEYKQALYHSPGYILTIKNLANLLEKQSKHAEALMMYRRYSYACAACYEPISKIVSHDIKIKNYAEAKSLLKNFLENRYADSKDKRHAHKLLKRVDRMMISMERNKRKNYSGKANDRKRKSL